MLSSRQQKTQISLYRACKNNSVLRAKSALDQGASIDLPDGTAGQNMPIHIAAMFGASHTIQLLFERGADLHVKNQRGRTALDVARRIGEKEAAALLETLAEGGRVHLEGSGDDDDDDNEQAQLSLFDACRSNEPLLATDAILGGADVDAADGSTASNRPLHVAAVYGACEVIELLCHYHASLGSLNGEGLTAVELARKSEQPKASSLLKELIDGRVASPPPGITGGGTGLVAQQGAAGALDGAVTFGEAPHFDQQQQQQPPPPVINPFALNGQPLPSFRSRGG